MNGTKVVVRLKKNDGKAKKVLYFFGLPRQYHLYLALKDDFEFCPEPMDGDTDFILADYRNVSIEITPVNIIPTTMRKLDHARAVIGKHPDKVEVQDEGMRVNKYTWHNVLAYKSTELVNAIGGFARDGKYILFEEEKTENGIIVG